VLALEQLAAAQAIDGAMLGGGHEPRAGIIWNAGCGPLFKGGDQRVLRKFLRKADVAQHAREAGYDTCGLDPPDGFDGAVGIGSGHDYR
jgi:arylsulfatase A-like enzyme